MEDKPRLVPQGSRVRSQAAPICRMRLSMARLYMTLVVGGTFKTHKQTKLATEQVSSFAISTYCDAVLRSILSIKPSIADNWSSVQINRG